MLGDELAQHDYFDHAAVLEADEDRAHPLLRHAARDSARVAALQSARVSRGRIAAGDRPVSRRFPPRRYGRIPPAVEPEIRMS